MPYSPEFLPRDGRAAGTAVLAEVAALSGGTRRADLTTVFADPPPRPAPTALWPYFAAACVVLLLVEVAGRRWGWRLPGRGAELVAKARDRTRDATPPPRVKPEPAPPSPTPVRVGPKRDAGDVFSAAKDRAGRRR